MKLMRNSEFTIYYLRHRLRSHARDLSGFTNLSTIPASCVNRKSQIVNHESRQSGCHRISKSLHLSLAILCLSLAGCTSPPVTPLGNGYEEVAHPVHGTAGKPADERVSLQHRGPDGKTTTIWPSLYGVDEVIHGDVAIFVGDQAYVSPDPDDSKGMKPRLFAVQSPALPLDITDEVLWRWSKASEKDFEKATQLFSLVTPAERNGHLELQLEFYTQERDWPDKVTMQLDWNQVSDMMRAVKAKGTLRRDLRWGAPYIEK